MLPTIQVWVNLTLHLIWTKSAESLFYVMAKFRRHLHADYFGFFVFNGISIFVGYLMSKLSL